MAISNCGTTLGGGHGEAEPDEKLEDKAEVSVDLLIGRRADGVVEIGHESEGDEEGEDIAENHADGENAAPARPPLVRCFRSSGYRPGNTKRAMKNHERQADQYVGGEDHLHELHEAFDRRGGDQFKSIVILRGNLPQWGPQPAQKRLRKWNAGHAGCVQREHASKSMRRNRAEVAGGLQLE